jgi:sugar lactone lactonase YvrE
VARRGRILKERAGGAWFAATRGFAFSSLCAAAAMLAAFCAPFCATASAQTPNVQFMGASAPLFTAGLSSPMFTAVDANGNVYISDTGNARVLKETLQANGSYVQSYVANNSFLIAPAGIAVDGSGNVYIADEGYAEWVIKMEPQTDGSYLEYTVKTSTPLSSPTNVAVDASGNVYIADTGNIRVLKETPNGNGTYKESTVANQTSIDVLYAPVGLALDSSGDVYIGDQSYNAIYEMELQSNGSGGHQSAHAHRSGDGCLRQPLYRRFGQ